MYFVCEDRSRIETAIYPLQKGVIKDITCERIAPCVLALAPLGEWVWVLLGCYGCPWCRYAAPFVSLGLLGSCSSGHVYKLSLEEGKCRCLGFIYVCG